MNFVLSAELGNRLLDGVGVAVGLRSLARIGVGTLDEPHAQRVAEVLL